MKLAMIVGGLLLFAASAHAQVVTYYAPYAYAPAYAPVAVQPVVAYRPTLTAAPVAHAAYYAPYGTGWAGTRGSFSPTSVGAVRSTTAYYAPAAVAAPVPVAPVPVPVATYYAPQAVAVPAPVAVVPAPVVLARPVVLGAGAYGQPTAYVPGQPIRNAIRSVTP